MARKIGLSVEEFYSEWATGEKEKFRVKVRDQTRVNGEWVPTEEWEWREVETEACSAQLGDFIRAYMEHLSIPPRHQRPDWDEVERLFRNELNKLGGVRFARRA